MVAHRRKLVGVALVAAFASLATGCAMVSKKTVFEDHKTTAVLRSRRGVARGFNHPVTIAPVRLAHILSRIDIRKSAKEGQTLVAGIPTESIDVLALALSKGLQQANENQEVVVSSVRTFKRWGLFNKDYLTSFVAYQAGDQLFIHLSRSDWEIPPRREDRLPEPEIGSYPSPFRVVPSKGMELVDPQAVSMRWRDEIFSRPTRTRVTPGGKTVRKEILMESDVAVEVDEIEEVEEIIKIPPGISPDALRELADLEDQRRSGEISEFAYARRRRQIIEAAAEEVEP